MVPPTSLEVKVAYTCRMQCKFCLFGDRSNWPLMSTQMIFDNISFHVDKCGINELIISGGEPTDREDLIDILEHATAIGIKKFYLHTNASNVSSVNYNFPSMTVFSTLSS